MHLGVGPYNKLDFFSYSSPVLYKSSYDLGLINSTALPLKKSKIIFNFKKMGKTLALILLAIVIKSICQYYLGAQETSLEKILLGIDYLFYEGCFLGGVIIHFFQDNWNNMWDSLRKNFTIKLDSGDEDSGDEGLKNSSKGKDKLTDSNTSSKAIDKGKKPEEVTSKKGSPSGSGREIIISREALVNLLVKYPLMAHEIAEDTKTYIENITEFGKSLENFNNLEFNKLNIYNTADADKFFLPLLQEHGKLYSRYLTSRSSWIISRAVNLQSENKTQVEDAIARMKIARDKFMFKLDDVSKHEDTTTQIKLFYAILNEQRNSLNKEFNKADDIIFKDLRASSFCTFKHKDCKNLVKILNDYTNAKIKFNIQDSILKKKIGEAINRKI